MFLHSCWTMKLVALYVYLVAMVQITHNLCKYMNKQYLHKCCFTNACMFVCICIYYSNLIFYVSYNATITANVVAHIFFKGLGLHYTMQWKMKLLMKQNIYA